MRRGKIEQRGAGLSISRLTPSEAHWPRQLSERLEDNSPSQLWAIGPMEVLAAHKVGLFCSVRCPGDAILRAYDAAQKLRDDGVTVVSGFHSPVEKECLRILLRGKQPIILCLARSLVKIRIPAEWRQALDSSRLLVLSPFERRPRRPDTKSAKRRNELVAALSDQILIVYAEPGGAVERISELVDRWRIPRVGLNSAT
jgi:predicted Rossmann fold nucleotide-binding protein DprA/Smf involved in DNA uptake